MSWSQPQALRSADVYFFDDDGGVRLPASWRVQYWKGGGFVDVAGASGYPTAVDSILLHEIGHSFGLDDFYDWTPTGVCCFLMKAGTAGQITEFDAWMFRDWWRHLKDRYVL